MSCSAKGKKGLGRCEGIVAVVVRVAGIQVVALPVQVGIQVPEYRYQYELRVVYKWREYY